MTVDRRRRQLRTRLDCERILAYFVVGRSAAIPGAVYSSAETFFTERELSSTSVVVVVAGQGVAANERGTWMGAKTAVTSSLLC